MLFRRRKSQPAPSPAPMVDPVIDAQIHWLGSRGLVLRQDVSREDWIAAAEDPTHPIALAVAQLNGAYCTEPEPSVTIEPGSLPDMVNSLADGLELPIDEALLDGDQLTIRSGSTYEKYDVSEADSCGTLVAVANTYVDSTHVLIRKDHTFAIAHRDIAEEVRQVMGALTTE
ncbi:hypothetical protein [Flaviflexus sp.]|uniref:hypothetical protein n=1 Tax=Flaviflexus sp. TaxID=1969482 RepID=UPI003F901C0B